MKLVKEFVKFAVEHEFRRILFTLAVCLSTVSVVLILDLGQTYKFRGAGFAAFLVGCLEGLFCFHTLPETMYKMKSNKGLSFSDALALTLRSYVLLIPFIPIIGPFLGRAFDLEKPKDPFSNGDD